MISLQNHQLLLNGNNIESNVYIHDIVVYLLTHDIYIKLPNEMILSHLVAFLLKYMRCYHKIVCVVQKF